uniref:Plexin b2b n=1 Tax=Hucho hucho TaxID=62062 RepID=A0A4W5MZK3_9TELE
MASWVQAAPLLPLLLLFCLSAAGGPLQEEAVLDFPSKTPINNVVQDPRSGRVYLGAVNTIYQLDAALREEARAETGPREDARTCTPPVSACQDTKPTPNVNKLLLVHPANGSLVVCGSRYRGICSLLNLTNVEQQLYYSDSKGERTYVASIEDGVAVVGVMSTYVKDGNTFNVFLVGKGYGSLDSSKLISTRILQDYRDWVVFESIVEASTVQATPFVPKYLHDFRHAFKEEGFVYFLFSRTMGSTDNKNFTFVSRLCEDDPHYYSYTELQLNCGPGNRYNKVQAAYVASPGKDPYDDSADSALCMYPLKAINERLVDLISACYSDSGKIAGTPAVDIPYSSKTDEFCTSRIDVSSKDTLNNFKCGADFLPAPLASKPEFALQAEVAITRTEILTAVAIAVENDHTIAFLGNSLGEVYKVRRERYGTGRVVWRRGSGRCTRCGSGGDRKLRVTSGQTGRRAVDDGCWFSRCTRRSSCRRAEEKNGWLWSPKQQCVKIVSFHPPNLSCKKTQRVVYCAGPCSGRLTPLSSSFTVTLYNCSMGREDCSLCKNADPKYSCVWCAKRRSCVYEKLCIDQATEDPQDTECPDPQITDIIPRYGPMKGGISVTIKGSNLGIHKEDIKAISVVGVPCIHQEDKYAVSTSVFSYMILQDPIASSVHPDKGSKAGGMVITISGSNLDTATREDITVTVGGVVCFSKAMTAKEAQAFVGDIPYFVNTLQDDKLFLDPPSSQPRALSKRHRRRRDTSSDPLDLLIKFGNGEWVVGSVHYERKNEVSLLIIPAVIVPMLLIILISVYCYRRKSQQAEREYEKVKHQLENLEESVRDRCKKEFTDLMIEMEDHTNDLSEGRIPFLDYKTYTDRVFFLPSKDGANDVMITGKLDIPEARKAIVAQALNQFSNLLNSKTFLINFIKTLEGRPDFNARAKVYFASLLTVALHGKLEYYTDIMRTLLLELMGNYVDSKNPKLMLRRSETVVERMLCNWMSICLYQFLKDSAGEPLYKLFRAIKHQIEKGPVDARVKKAKYTLNDTGLLGDDVEYCVLVSDVLVHGEGPDVTPVKVLNCDTVSQVKEKIIEAVYRNLPYSQRPKVDSVTLEWRPGSTGQILSDLDLTSQKEGRWRRINTLAHYNVRDNATLVLSQVLHTQQNYDQNQDSQEERNSFLDDDKVFHLVRPDELDEMKSKRGSMKDKSMTKAITEIYLTRLLSVKGTLQQFVDDFFHSVLCSGAVVPPAVKYFFDFLDEQALKHENVDEETIHIWKTNSLPLRFWVNIMKNPHFIFDVHVTEVVDASLSVIAQTFMDACTKSEHKLSRDSPSNKLLYAKEISTYKKMVDDYYKGIRQMVSVSDQDMNTHLAEVSRTHTDKLNIQVALYQLYQYASKYYDGIIQSLDEDPAAQSKQLTLRLQQIAAALENKVTDL